MTSLSVNTSSGWWRRVHRHDMRYVSEDWTTPPCSTCSGLPSSPVWRTLPARGAVWSHQGVRSTTHQFCARPRPAPRILSTGPADIWWTDVWHRRRRTIQYKKAVLSQRWPRDARYISSRCGDMVIRNYPRWRPPPYRKNFKWPYLCNGSRST